jgi:hypothetical protein
VVGTDDRRGGIGDEEADEPGGLVRPGGVPPVTKAAQPVKYRASGQVM